MLVLLLLMLCVLLLVYGGLAAPVVFLGVMFVGFWLIFLRALIGFGRWLTGGGEKQPAFGPEAPRRLGPPARGRVCSNSRCGRVNLSSARYCAQCGSVL